MATFGRIVLDGIEPVSYPAGLPIVGATLTINITGAGLATIYADHLGATPILNPQTSDSAGRFYAQATTIWADMANAYDLVVTYPAGGSTTYPNVYPLGAPVNTSGFITNPNANLTGIPTATTASLGTATSQLATTAFVQNAINAISIFPTGMFAMFGMTSIPSGWLVCDGSAVSRTTYAALFAQISTTYGVGNGTTTFGLPPAQGQFLRVYNATGSGVDSGRSLGTTQADQFQGHYHTHESSLSASYGRATSGGGTGIPSGSGANEPTNATGAPVTDGSNGTPRTGTETRPTNINLVLCIKT